MIRVFERTVPGLITVSIGNISETRRRVERHRIIVSDKPFRRGLETLLMVCLGWRFVGDEEVKDV